MRRPTHEAGSALIPSQLGWSRLGLEPARYYVRSEDARCLRVGAGVKRAP